jgi:uncharacterized protein
MKPKPPDPRRLDVAAFAARAMTLSDVCSLDTMPRLFDATATAPSTPASVHWTLTGASPRGADGSVRVVLQVQARAEVPRVCQRCLETMVVAVTVNRHLRFVVGEEEAARLDADGDEDVLALEPTLDALALIEDELLLAMPLVPKHERCVDVGIPASAGDAATGGKDDADKPFAALAALRRPASH